MEKVFESIFSQIHECIGNHLKTAKANQHEASNSNSAFSGSQKFEIFVDGSGKARKEITQRGYGCTVNIRAVLFDPKDGDFDIEVTSTGGGNISKRGIKADTAVEGQLKMKGGFSQTTITADIHSSMPNTVVKGKIDYWI